MRLLISVSFDDTAKNNLIDIMDNLKKCSRKGVFILRNHLRLDLLLLTETQDIRPIQKTIEEINFKPFNIKFTRIDRSRRDGGDIYWAVADPSSELIDIYSKLINTADEFGSEYDKKPFKPRVQLGTRVIARPNFKVNEFETQINNITVSECITTGNGKEILKKLFVKNF